MTEPQEWQDRAACNDSLFDFFTNDYWEVKACVMTCAGCPVRRDCLNYALDNYIDLGIWGGVKGPTLNVLRKRLKRNQPVPQLQPGYVNDWSIGGKWERWAGYDHPRDDRIGRPREDNYLPEYYRRQAHGF
jgi:hypothetical protein